jgi:hypothetical protein
VLVARTMTKSSTPKSSMATPEFCHDKRTR